MSEHHPSCRPSDRDLVWHCNQCGLNEPAEDELTKLREELREAWDVAASWELKARGLKQSLEGWKDAAYEQVAKIKKLREEVKNTLEALVEITKCNTDLQRIISDLHIDIAKLREAPLVEGSPSVRIGPLPLSGETPQSVYPPHRGTADSTGHGQPL